MHKQSCWSRLHPLVHGLPAIVFLSTTDRPGAGQAALDLFRGLRAAGVKATMLTLDRTRTSDGLEQITDARKFLRIMRALSNTLLRPYSEVPPGFELFTTAKGAPALQAAAPALRSAGLIHLHWVARMVDWSRPPELLRNKPLVWTLHDMNPLTGGCHYTAGCGRWRAGGCTACPQLGTASEGRDLAQAGFDQKMSAYAELDLHIVSPSRWLGRCAEQSLLLHDRPVTVIPYGVDDQIFRPEFRAASRATLDIPEGRKVLCFGAAGINRRNKGLPLLVHALNILRQRHDIPLPLLLTFGGESSEWVPEGYEFRQLGWISQAGDIAAAYTAADGFIAPSFQDNFPNTLLESLACGTPAIGFYNTGAEDIIEDGVTGFLARHPGLPITEEGDLLQQPYLTAGDTAVEDLSSRIFKLLTLSDTERQAMRTACRRRAERLYTLPRQVESYLRLYRNILGLSASTN